MDLAGSIVTRYQRCRHKLRANFPPTPIYIAGVGAGFWKGWESNVLGLRANGDPALTPMKRGPDPPPPRFATAIACNGGRLLYIYMWTA